MSTETRIGKIQKISVGFGGYQDAVLGLSITLGSPSWGVCDFKGFWGPDIEHSKYCKWTETSRREAHADTMLFIGKILKDANKNTVDQLANVPVEVTFESNILKSWRVLTEVI